MSHGGPRFLACQSCGALNGSLSLRCGECGSIELVAVQLGPPVEGRDYERMGEDQPYFWDVPEDDDDDADD